MVTYMDLCRAPHKSILEPNRAVLGITGIDWFQREKMVGRWTWTYDQFTIHQWFHWPKTAWPYDHDPMNAETWL